MTTDRRHRKRRALGPTLGRPARGLGAQRGPAGPDLRGGTRARRARAGQLVLDIGCGVGAFLRLVAERGARRIGHRRVRGADRRRTHATADADLRVGDMEALPYDDDTFDLVTGFNSFFFANDIVAALREAGRVAKPGAPVVIQVWGPHERNDLEAMKAIVRPLLPAPPADAPAEPDYSEPGVLEDIATRAGLEPGERVRHHLGLRVRGRGDRPARDGRARRARPPRRPRPRGRGQGRDRARPRRPTAPPTAATGSRTTYHYLIARAR